MRHTPQVLGEGQLILDVGEHYILLFLVRGRHKRLLTKIAVLKDAEVVPVAHLERIA